MMTVLVLHGHIAMVLFLSLCSCEVSTAFLSLSSLSYLHRLHGGARPPRITYAPHGSPSMDVFFEEHDLDSDALTSISGTDEKGIFVSRRTYDSRGGMISTGPMKLFTPLMLLWEEGPGNILSQLFLPTGFAPKALHEYLHYQRWNLLQDACSYLRGIMGTQALLTGMGVGRADMSALQATVQWVLRDGASMIGSLLFTSFFSANFGQNIKSWRLFADLINNVGITLDIIAPLTGKHFLAVVCIASIFKALCGVAAGATNAVIGEHWGSKNGNMADVMAKNGAQHTCINLLGLAVSVKFANFVSLNPQRMWSTYAILTFIHVISNMKAMRVLALRSLNLARYQMLMQRFLKSPAMLNLLDVTIRSSTGTSQEGDQQLFESAMGQLERGIVKGDLLPTSIAKKEPILSLITPRPWKFIIYLLGWIRIHFSKLQWYFNPTDNNSTTIESLRNSKNNDILIPDISAQRIHQLAMWERNRPVDSRISSQLGNICLWATPAVISARFTKKEITDAMIQFDRLNYFIISTCEERKVPSQKRWFIQRSPRAQIYVCFRKGASLKDQAKAAFEAQVYDLTRTTASARQITLNVFPIFWTILEQNEWDLTRLLLRPRVARVYEFPNKNSGHGH